MSESVSVEWEGMFRPELGWVRHIGAGDGKGESGETAGGTVYVSSVRRLSAGVKRQVWVTGNSTGWTVVEKFHTRVEGFGVLNEEACVDERSRVVATVDELRKIAETMG